MTPPVAAHSVPRWNVRETDAAEGVHVVAQRRVEDAPFAEVSTISRGSSRSVPALSGREWPVASTVMFLPGPRRLA